MSCCVLAFAGCDDEASTSTADDMGVSACMTGETQDCSAEGGNGSQTCTAEGNWGTCTRKPAEQCNNIDDNGDGNVDEGQNGGTMTRACNTACGSGTEDCEGGSWIGCTAPAPGTEICDGMDNDCDGRVDENITRACEGECGMGMERCSLGAWIGCDAQDAAPETCNGIDDDCDGTIDESLARGCESACGQGAETCSDGMWGDCSAPLPQEMEICGNDKDDNCDGQIDEGCADCVVDSTTICSVNEGVCEQGVKTCNDAGEWGDCMKDGVAVVVPGEREEICNGIDDSCNGAVDDVFPGQGEGCGVDVGACQVGIRACRDGGEICINEVAPRDEVCDGVDNNCDGTADEDLGGDQWENNQTCAEAENIGDILEGSERRVFTGSVYPDGDLDYYAVRVEELNDLCVPLIGNDDGYQVFVEVSNLPEGADYELCISVGEERDIGDYCVDDALLAEEFCTNNQGEGLLALNYAVDPTCAFNDDTTVMIKVSAGEGQSSCQPYTVTVWAETIVTE